MKLHQKVAFGTLLAALSPVLDTPAFGQIQSAPCHDQWPSWSPDGESIVFSSTRTGDPEIFTLSLADGQVQQLTDTPGRDAHPSFSPDGRQITFQSPRGDGHTNLYLMNSDGTGLRRLTHETGFLGVPVFSPDGRRLAYQWRSEADSARWQLMMLTLADGSTQAITDGSANDQVVNWAPDGSGVVFHSDRTGKNQVYRWSDGVTTQLTETPFDDRNASWSPDQGTISFVSNRDNDQRAVYVMNADGSNVRKVGAEGVRHSLPLFSPDGKELLITPSTETGTEIWVLSVEDGSARKLTECGSEQMMHNKDD